jgi:23S rRNA (uridine2552-2'-O)-methyltransferase
MDAAQPCAQKLFMTIHIRNNKINKAWLLDHLNDPYVKLAQKEGYRARAAYKLKELDETFRLVKPGHVVVDLGAVPGAWSQYLRRKLAIKGNEAQSASLTHVNGTLIALDLLDFEPIDGVHFIQGDFREEAVLQTLEATLQSRKVNVVLSDMAPNLSGIESADAARMADLVELALDFAVRHLHHDGALVAKVFHGSGYSQLVQAFKTQFRVVKAHKPKASRDRSSETFLVGLGLKSGKA